MKIKFNYFSVINLSMLIIPAFVFLMIYTTNINIGSTNMHFNVNLNKIAGYLKFLFASKSTMMFDIAYHNFILSLIFCLLTMFSFGLLGVFSLISTFSIAAITIKTSPDFFTISFVILEMFGMLIAILGGNYIAHQRAKNKVSLNKMFLLIFILIITLALIYTLAAYIESDLLYNIQR